MLSATNIPGPPPQTASFTNGIRGIKPPVAIANPWVWVGWGVGALALAALLYLAWRFWLAHKAGIPGPPPVPAHLRARQRLLEALALIAQPKPFCILVSDTIRGYLEERFNFRAPERTTEEFLHELAGTDLLAREQKDSLADFLQRCDLVKFARYEPAEPELRDLHHSALRLIQETEPDPEPPTPGGSPAENPASPAGGLGAP